MAHSYLGHIFRYYRCFAGLSLFVLFTACTQNRTELLPTISPTPTIFPTSIAALTAAPSPSEIPTPPRRRLKPGELILAADSDDIPAIDAQPEYFVDVNAGIQEWQDDDLVIGLEINGETRAYPIRLLSSHEIVNDEIDGQPVAITWCPLCFSAIVYDRVLEGQTLTFAVSGFLYRDNLVMFDRQSNTLWSQLAGQGIKGPKNGDRLTILPAIMTTWLDWRTGHPQTTVLSVQKITGQSDEIIDPYAGYYSSEAAGIAGEETFDETLPAKTLVLGIQIGKTTRAYPLETVQQATLINDKIAEFPIIVFFDDKFQAIQAYRAEIDGQILTFSVNGGVVQDEATRSTWDLSQGIAIKGALQGKELVPLSAAVSFWFAWSKFHPNSTIYQP